MNTIRYERLAKEVCALEGVLNVNPLDPKVDLVLGSRQDYYDHYEGSTRYEYEIKGEILFSEDLEREIEKKKSEMAKEVAAGERSRVVKKLNEGKAQLVRSVRGLVSDPQTMTGMGIAMIIVLASVLNVLFPGLGMVAMSTTPLGARVIVGVVGAVAIAAVDNCVKEKVKARNAQLKAQMVQE